MRNAAPWLTSLILHSLFLSGIFILSSTPREFPQQLVIDFQLAPEFLAEVDDLVETTPPPAPSPPVKKLPQPVKKEILPVKPAPPPEPVAEISDPPPIPEVKEVAPIEEIEPAAPQDIPVEETLPAVEPPAMVAQAAAVETLAPVPTTNAETDNRAAEEVRYAQTVSHVRGQVLNKLRYPAIARRMGWCGEMVLGFVLCADGTVENLEVLESSGHKVLDRAAVQAVKANAPFSGGYPRTEVRLPIVFELN